MPHEEQDAARRAVLKWLAAHQRPRSWLWRTAGVSPNTLNDWLRGDRSITEVTQGRIESALGWEAGTIMATADETGIENVSTPIHNAQHPGDDLLYRRPEGLTDEEWASVRQEVGDYIEWLIWRTSGGDTTQP